MKLLIFLPIIIFFGFFGLLVFGFLFLIFKLIMKSKNSSWQGKVVDKKFFQKTRDDDGIHKKENFYHLVVETDSGKTMKVGLSGEMWDKFSIGDKITKPKGSLYPSKIS